MRRWIDADAFLKEYCEPYPHVYMAMSKAVADAPTIDIVRCRECKHWIDDRKSEDDMGTCGLTHYFTNADDYCSYGERRE